LSNVEKERHATWLELFYDLIFAAAVSQIGLSLDTSNTSITAFLGTISLFFPVVWAWLGVTFYATRFETDDLVHRLLVLLQMVGAAALTINIHGASGETSGNFAISYAAIRTFLVIEYIRAGRKIPTARTLANRYAQGFSISTILWLISAAVPIPIRFVLWVLALAIDVLTTILIGRKHLRLAPNIFHLPERMGLFTLIVLGETIFGLISSLSGHKWTIESTISIGAGLGIAFSLWWIYFDRVDGSPIRAFREKGRIGVYTMWLYIHFPLVVGLVTTAIGIRDIVSSAENIPLSYTTQWLICGSVSLCLFSIGIIHLSIASAAGERKVMILYFYKFIAGLAIITIPVFTIRILPSVLIMIITIICMMQIILDLRHHPHHRIF
jgi:low temperature requirement protein LtrA